MLGKMTPLCVNKAKLRVATFAESYFAPRLTKFYRATLIVELSGIFLAILAEHFQELADFTICEVLTVDNHCCTLTHPLDSDHFACGGCLRCNSISRSLAAINFCCVSISCA